MCASGGADCVISAKFQFAGAGNAPMPFHFCFSGYDAPNVHPWNPWHRQTVRRAYRGEKIRAKAVAGIELFGWEKGKGTERWPETIVVQINRAAIFPAQTGVWCILLCKVGLPAVTQGQTAHKTAKQVKQILGWGDDGSTRAETTRQVPGTVKSNAVPCSIMWSKNSPQVSRSPQVCRLRIRRFPPES